MLQHFQWEDSAQGGSDCRRDNPRDCWFTPTGIDLSEYSMNLLSNIAHSGTPNMPRPVPEYLNSTATIDATWAPFDPVEPLKNIIYVETMKLAVDLKIEPVPNERLNHFYVSRPLILDFEADRKAHCKAPGKHMKRQPESNKKILQPSKLLSINTSPIVKTELKNGPSVPSDSTTVFRSTTSGLLQGVLSPDNVEVYQNFLFAQAKRFEYSSLVRSTETIYTNGVRRLCPNSRDSDSQTADNEECLKMSIYVPKSYKRGVIYFVTDMESEVTAQMAYQQDMLIFVVNLRNEVLAYLYQGMI